MACYVIGDLHGCYDAFERLLTKIKFNPHHDHLYLVGDLINRGPDSLSTMRKILELGDSVSAILGNHDLAFLAYANGSIPLFPKDSYDELLNHSDSDHIINYLRQLPLFLYLKEWNIAIVHGGISPLWSVSDAVQYSKEIENQLMMPDEQYASFIDHLFGNQPNYWRNDLEGIDRLRSIVNHFTRMRFLHSDYSLDFKMNDTATANGDLQPWFQYERQNPDITLIFGHWASLGLHYENNSYCIDSGCVWGNQLTAMQIDTQPFQLTHVKA